MNQSITIERIIKAVVAYNGGEVKFLHDYLKHLDNFDLKVLDDGETVTLKVKIKG